ncbi:MAG: hypothetical protein C4523_04500 [Myxococcales bacterium]|nr:MAG: hypothetical protein C4523_04500 [Myxococcales bacterium]
MKTTTKQMLIAAIAATTFVWASGCWKSDGQERLDELYPPDGDEDAEELDIAEVELEEFEAESLAGRWALHVYQQGTISPLASPWDIAINDLFIADIDAAQETMTLTFCNQIANIDSGGGSGNALGQSKTPELLQNAIAESPLEIGLPGDGTLPKQTDLVWTWGLHDMDDPANTPLPEAAGDSLVWDQDEDTNPGVTLEILNPEGHRYMVRRAVWTWQAAEIDDDWSFARGDVTFRVDEKALGADNALLETVAPITANAEGNFYQMIRVGGEADAGDYDCARLREEWLGLFPQQEN